MRRVRALPVLLSLLVACASVDPRSAENEIRQVEKDWNQSRIAGDAHRVAELHDDSWTTIHVDGRVEHKQSYVAGIASGDRHILSIEVVDQSIRIDPPVALVVGEVNAAFAEVKCARAASATRTFGFGRARRGAWSDRTPPKSKRIEQPAQLQVADAQPSSYFR